jgi:chromosome segregation ATPase
MTIVLVLLTLSAVGAAGFAILFLSKVKKNLSELGIRVLESQDIGKVKEAAQKAGSFESRMAGCEQKTDETKNLITGYETKLDELNGKLGESGQKIDSFEGRFNELSTRLDSIEQMTKKNGDDLAQTVPNIKALADEIQKLKMFQATTEKVHGLIQSAYTDIQASIPPEGDLLTVPQVPTFEDETPEEAKAEETEPENAMSEDVKPEDSSQGPEELHDQNDPNRVTGSRRWQS